MKTQILLLAYFIATVLGLPSIPEPRDEPAWLAFHDSFVNNSASNTDIPLLFYGDSLTDDWDEDGREIWEGVWSPLGVANYGLKGDRVEHVLWRIINGEVIGLNPNLIVLKIGTNNINNGDSPRDIADGIKVILDTLNVALPNTKILLLSILPRTGEEYFLKIAQVNIYISKYQDRQRVWYLNLFDHFGEDWGSVSNHLFYDGLHLYDSGYRLWYKIMYPWFFALCECSEPTDPQFIVRHTLDSSPHE